MNRAGGRRIDEPRSTNTKALLRSILLEQCFRRLPETRRPCKKAVLCVHNAILCVVTCGAEAGASGCRQARRFAKVTWRTRKSNTVDAVMPWLALHLM